MSFDLGQSFSRLVRGWDKRKVTGLVAVVAGAIGLWGWLSNDPFAGDDACDSSPLRHVYRPGRLFVVAKCQQITFRVVAFRKEHDGDVHLNGTVLGATGWVDAANVRGQHGLTVVEFVPGDPRPPRFFAGQLLKLTVTKVYDDQHKRPSEAHGWVEGHPDFAAKDVTPANVSPLPNKSSLAPPTEK